MSASVSTAPAQLGVPLRPLHVVMMCLAGGVITGGFLLLSAAESTTLVDGAVEWHAESPLRAIVQLLCLNYSFPTLNAGDIKGYLLGIGAGIGLIVLGVGGLARPVTAEIEVPTDGTDFDALTERPRKTHLPPLVAAQFLALLYVLWSFASSRWSASPRLSIGGSVLWATGFFWSFCLGQGLSVLGARWVCRVLLVVTGITSVVALWYYFGRNPTLRAKFPFGNPNFLAAALIPGVILALATAAEKWREFMRTDRWQSAVWCAIAVAVIALSGWTLTLSDSRGANVGLVVGIFATLLFGLPGRWKVVPLLIGIVGLLAATWYFVTFLAEPSATGRDATMRLRVYAWSYAWRMFQDRPLTGHGQGGFAMAGDSLSAGDVLADPPVFESRIDHAHNEWLEVMADLGAVGLILIAAALLLTLYAAGRARRELGGADRAVVTALLGALVGLVVSETFGVGLRVCEVPLAFFTVLGLLWAFARTGPVGRWWEETVSRSMRTFLAVLGLVTGPAALIATQQDFFAARQAYRTDTALQQADFESAIRAATLATDRLYPQRILMNYFRLAQTHLLAAEDLQNRASDRERRATETEPANPRLQLLAAEDYRAAEEQCKAASHALKELVSAAPAYINHGQLEYRINLVLARVAASRGEMDTAQAYARNAATAIERELTRQPFDPDVALNFMRLVAQLIEPARVMDILSRPLRYNRVSDEAVAFLRDLVRNDTFATEWARVLDEAENAAAPDRERGVPETWAPEKLRLGATLDFIQGDYSAAVHRFEQAALRYDRLGAGPPLGAASCYAELADCRFYADPQHPAPAIDAAQRALEITAESRPGRELRSSIRQRLIHYYLAAGEEDEARRVLRELAPASVQPHVLENELGSRYRRLCESLLQRRENQTLRKPTDDLLPRLIEWLRRAIELNPADPAAYFVAADLAFHAGDDAQAAQHLAEALRRGLPPEEAARFLEAALAKRPESDPLSALQAALLATPNGTETAPKRP